MNQIEKLTLTIIGAGRVGQTLGKLFVESGLVNLKYVVDIDLPSTIQAVDFITAGQPLDSLAEIKPTDLYFLAVGDRQIASVAEELSSLLDLSDAIVFHASGALSSDILKATGATVATVHPICSFVSPHLSVLHFKGTYCGMEGDQMAIEKLRPLFTAIGGNCIEINASGKTLYHAAAVFASNFLPVVIESSIQCYIKAGLTREVAMKLAEPLAKNALENIFKVGTDLALSGPVVRGDFGTVEAHQKELSRSLPHEAKVYSCLNDALKKLASK